jgi:hypothetical protein
MISSLIPNDPLSAIVVNALNNFGIGPTKTPVTLNLPQNWYCSGASTLQAPSSPWPANGSTSAATTLTLQWGAVSGATQYQVYFGSNSTSLPLYATVSAPTVTAAVYNLAAGTTYYWKVVAIAGSSSASSAVWSFTTPGGGSQTLSAPTVVWPLNGSTSDATTLDIQWSAVSGATQYQVYFGSSSTSPPLYTTVSAPAVTAALYNLAAGATYYWKVVATAGSSSTSSAVWSFTTPGGSGTLSAPTLVWPLNGSTSAATTLTIQWSAVSGATQYQVYFGSNSTSLPLYATVSAPTVTAAVYNLNAGATYYWKVVAIAGSSSASSAVWSFTTPGGSTLSPPTVVWPLSGSTGNATTLTVQWSPVAGATQYQVYFGSSSSGLALYTTVNAPSVNAAFYNLSAASTYYWQVVALAGGSSASSAVWSFRTN